MARAALLLGAASLFAAAAHAAVKSAWADGAPRKQPFSRILIVGISPNVDQRCPFERSLAAKIKSESTVAIVSCDVVAERNPLTRESIEAAVAAKNADAVLATSLVSQQWDVKEGGTYSTRGGGQYKAIDSYYGVYGTPVVYADFQTTPSITTMKGEAHVTSKLYETKGETLVYTLDTTVRDLETRQAGLAEVVAGIGKKLRKDGLVR